LRTKPSFTECCEVRLLVPFLPRDMLTTDRAAVIVLETSSVRVPPSFLDMSVLDVDAHLQAALARCAARNDVTLPHDVIVRGDAMGQCKP
jgi:hypothetical protein